MKVFIRHVRKSGTGRDNCTRGIRAFAKKHNLDYSDFIFNGIDSELLLETEDPFAIEAVNRAKKDGF